MFCRLSFHFSNDRCYTVNLGAGNAVDAAMRAQAHANQLAAAAGLMPAYGYGGAGAAAGMGGAAAAAPGQRPAMPTMAETSGNTRVCDFYQSARGCVKSERCDFIHAAGAAAAPQAQAVMDPYGAQAATGANANYAALAAATASYGSYQYPVQQQAAYGYYAPDGSVVPAAQGYTMPAAYTPTASGAGNKVCSFYGTARGCRKGTRCDFVHPADAAAGSARPTARYSPY